MKGFKGLILIGSGVLAAQQGLSLEFYPPTASSSESCVVEEQSSEAVEAAEAAAQQKEAEEEAQDLALRESLVEAIEAKDESQVKELLTQMIDPSRVIENPVKGSLLHYAVQSDSVAIVEAVASTDANKAAFNRDGFNSLHLALSLNNPHSEEIALKLLELGISYNTTVRSSGKSPLHFAAASGKTRVLSQVIKSRVESIDVEDKSGETALSLAAQADEEAAVDVLIRYGADVHKESEVNGQTVFDKGISGPMAQHIRYREGLRQHSHAKLAEGVRKQEKSKVEEAFAEGASIKGDYFSEGQWSHKGYEDGDSILHIAAAYGNINFIREYLPQFTDEEVKAENLHGLTPLRKAVNANHGEVAKVLMERVSGFVVEDDGTSALAKLHEAIKQGKKDEFSYFLRNLSNKEVNEKDGSGKTALDYALDAGQMSFADSLFKMIPSLSLVDQNPDKENLLHVAVRLGRVDGARYLIMKEHKDKSHKKAGNKKRVKRKGRKKKQGKLGLLRTKNKAGQTPLQLALDLKNQEIAHFLINNVEEIQVSEGDTTGKTRVHLALEKSVEDAMNYFVSYGDSAEVNAVDNKDHTALRHAVDLAQDSNQSEELRAFAKHYTHELVTCVNGLVPHQPIHWAAKNNRADVVHYHLMMNPKNNKPFNTVDGGGRTALWYAQDEDDKKIIKLLMSRVPKGMRNTGEEEGQLWYAAKARRADIVRYYLRRVTDLRASFDANAEIWDQKTLKEKETELADAYLKHWRVGQENGYTPLHNAAYNGDVEVMKLLINNKPKVKDLEDLFDERTTRKSDRSQESYDTALHLASRRDHLECVKLLLDAGVDTYIKNRQGQTPWTEYKEKTKDTAKGKNKGKKRLDLSDVEEEIRELLKHSRKYDNSKSQKK